MRIYVAGLRAIFIPSSIYTFLYHLSFQINIYNFYNQKNILLLQEKNAGRGNVGRKNFRAFEETSQHHFTDEWREVQRSSYFSLFIQLTHFGWWQAGIRRYFPFLWITSVSYYTIYCNILVDN